MMNLFKNIGFNICTKNTCITNQPSQNGLHICAEGDGFEAISEIAESKHGVFSRKDFVKNTSDKSICFNKLKSKFVLDNSEYEVYTQFNFWQNESRGSWTDLVSHTGIKCDSVRTSAGANPFLVIWNKQTNRGICLHLIPYCSWSIDVNLFQIYSCFGEVVIEMGINADNLNLEIGAGETYELPEILYYEVENKTDLDCYKLHRYLNDRFTWKTPPVIYNTWLFRFDKFDFESISQQIKKASDLGVEYFVIDAGWFGLYPNWSSCVGDWQENEHIGFKGRMNEIADLVRANGMKFGLWLEMYRAVEGSEFFEKNRKHYIQEDNNFFLNFASCDAREYMLGLIDKLIKTYGIKFFKFDFNADLTFDTNGKGFSDYFNGYTEFLTVLKERYPDLHLENCASGGMQLNLSVLKYFDSIWPTDNQGIYNSVRILKDTILRMPPQLLERWTVLNMSKPVANHDNGVIQKKYAPVEHLFSTGNGTFTHIEGVQDSYLKGFLSGGPLGLSFDLESLNEEKFTLLKDHIKEFKNDREFYKNAEFHILADTNTLLIFQITDREFKKSIIQIFIKNRMQLTTTIYPVVDLNKNYLSGDTKLSGKEIAEKGISVKLSENLNTDFVILEEII